MRHIRAQLIGYIRKEKKKYYLETDDMSRRIQIINLVPHHSSIGTRVVMHGNIRLLTDNTPIFDAGSYAPKSA